MGRVLAVAALAASLAGCDLAPPAVVDGAAQAQQAGEARHTEERVRQQLDAAQQLQDEQRRAAESEGR